MQADEYVLLGAALALEIAEGLSGDALDVAAALYTAIGDQLALISAQKRNRGAKRLCALSCKLKRMQHARLGLANHAGALQGKQSAKSWHIGLSAAV